MTGPSYPVQAHSQSQDSSGLFKRLLPLIVLLVGFGMFFVLGLDRYVSVATLRDNREVLLTWVQEHQGLAAFTYMAVYAMAVVFSLPVGAILSITGGFLFGSVWGTILIVASVTPGASVLFLIAKTSLGDPLRAKAGPWLQNMQAGFQDNALSYLLVLRLVPLFPFFVVNLVPAFLGVSPLTYVLGTFVGIIPGCFVYASVGAGLGSILDSGGSISAEGILTPQIIIALSGLAVLALVPVLYKQIRKRRNAPAPRPNNTSPTKSYEVSG